MGIVATLLLTKQYGVQILSKQLSENKRLVFAIFLGGELTLCEAYKQSFNH